MIKSSVLNIQIIKRKSDDGYNNARAKNTRFFPSMNVINIGLFGPLISKRFYTHIVDETDEQRRLPGDYSAPNGDS